LRTIQNIVKLNIHQYTHYSIKMAPSLITTILELSELQKRSSQSDLTPKYCESSTKPTSALTKTCCPSVGTCIPNTDICAMPFMPSATDTTEKLYVKQSYCLIKEQEQKVTVKFENGTTSIGTVMTTAVTDPTSISYPSQTYPGSAFGWNDMPDSGEDGSSITPLMFTYPLLILVVITVAMVSTWVFFWRRKVRRRENEGWHGGNDAESSRGRGTMARLVGVSAENGEEQCHSNDSTVDLELPPYEEHSWTSRWAAYGRGRLSGGAGDIIEIVNLRGERGEVVPVALVRSSSPVIPESAVPSTDSKSQRWLGKLRGLPRLGRPQRNTGLMTEQRHPSEWSINPPVYTEGEAAGGVKPPEPAVVVG
jgi:membrane protein implicated in regulation of membrane protease activity